MTDNRPFPGSIPHQPLRLADIIPERDDLREQARRDRVTIDNVSQDRDEEMEESDRLRARMAEKDEDSAAALKSAHNAKTFAREDRDRAEEKVMVTTLKLERLQVASRAVCAAAERSDGLFSGELVEALAEMKRVEEEMRR